MQALRHLHGDRRKTRVDLECSLTAYNAGYSALRRYGGIRAYAEKQNYVRSVLGWYRQRVEGVCLH